MASVGSFATKNNMKAKTCYRCGNQFTGGSPRRALCDECGKKKSIFKVNFTKKSKYFNEYE